VALAFATFAVWNGVTGFGSHSLINSAVFGAPLFAISLFDAPRPAARDLWPVLAALAAGVLLGLPRLVAMIVHASGDDGSRALGENVVYSEGALTWGDMTRSLFWASKLAVEDGRIHEHHAPIGPLLVLFALVPRSFGRLACGLGLGLLLAMLFATDTTPVSTALLSIPLLESFRGPGRALLPVVTLLPMLALAAWWSAQRLATEETLPVHWSWLGALAAIIAVLAFRGLDARVREVLAWLLCIGAVGMLRFAPARFARARLSLTLPAIAAFSLIGFADRIPRGLPVDPIEHGPAQLRAAVLADAPELKMHLHRVEVVNAPQPYGLSLAPAAGLPSLGGSWFPPRRFLTLLGALHRRPIPSTTSVFDVTRTPAFRTLQQLYNVRYVLQYTPDGPGLVPQPPTPGPAWFVSRIESARDAPQIVDAWRRLPDPTVGLRTTGWVLAGDPPLTTAAECETARVVDVATDEVGQRATLTVDTPATCALIVATTHVSTLTATIGESSLPVAPIDIALTAIEVPAGKHTIVLEPEITVPLWTRLASLLGVLILAAGAYVAARRSS
jgi:hypothetical protein